MRRDFPSERFGPEYQSSVLNYFLRPRLDIGTSISTDGDTSEVYTGLTWDVSLTRRLFLEGSAGAALHPGDDHDFGCTANFRTWKARRSRGRLASI